MSDIRPFPPVPPDPGVLARLIKGVVKVGKKIIKGIKTAWEVITGRDETQEEIADKKGFNPEKSEANDIAELNKLLNEYKANISAAANDLEREMIVEYADQLDEIMSVFEECNKDLKIVRSETVRRRFKRMNNGLKGTFEEYISKRTNSYHIIRFYQHCFRCFCTFFGRLRQFFKSFIFFFYCLFCTF